MTASGLPPGWPPQVHPPGSSEFERTALGWLYDRCPPEVRTDPVLRRYPQILARLAVACQQGAADGLRDSVRTLRAEFTGAVDGSALTALVELYAREADRAVAAARGASLIGEALAGRRWVPRL